MGHSLREPRHAPCLGLRDLRRRIDEVFDLRNATLQIGQRYLGLIGHHPDVAYLLFLRCHRVRYGFDTRQDVPDPLRNISGRSGRLGRKRADLVGYDRESLTRFVVRRFNRRVESKDMCLPGNARDRTGEGAYAL